MKLYGIQVNPEWQGEFEFDYLKEDIMHNFQELAILPQRDTYGIVPTKVEEIKEIMENDDFTDILEDLDKGLGRDNYNCHIYGIKKIKEAFDYFMRGYEFTRKQRVEVKKAIIESDCYYGVDADALARVMSAVTGENWESGCIRGCSQGDYAEIVYNADKCTDGYIDWVEAVYFNTGTEWKLVETEAELEIDCDDAEEFEDCLLAKVEELYGEEGYCEYVADWDAKRGLAESHGIEEEDITLFECNWSYIKHTSYTLAS